MHKFWQTIKAHKTGVVRLGVLSALVIVLGAILIQVELPQSAVSQFTPENEDIGEPLLYGQQSRAALDCENPGVIITFPARESTESGIKYDYSGQTFVYSPDLTSQVAHTAVTDISGSGVIGDEGGYGGRDIAYGKGNIYLLEKESVTGNDDIVQALEFKEGDMGGPFAISPSNSDITAISYGEDKIFYHGASQHVAVLDGTTLEKLSGAGPSGNVNHIAYGNGYFFALGNSIRQFDLIPVGVDKYDVEVLDNRDVVGADDTNRIDARGANAIYYFSNNDNVVVKIDLVSDGGQELEMSSKETIKNYTDIFTGGFQANDLKYHSGFLYVITDDNTFKLDGDSLAYVDSNDIGGDSIIGLGDSVYVSNITGERTDFDADPNNDVINGYTYRFSADTLDQIGDTLNVGGYLEGTYCIGTISGHVFFDRDGNKTLSGDPDSGGDIRLPILSITAEVQLLDGNTEIDSTVITEENDEDGQGYFAFYDIDTNAGSRTLTVRIVNHTEIINFGFSPVTKDYIESVVVTLTAQGSVSGLNFGYGTGRETNTLTVEGEFIAPKVYLDR